jgi:LPXTG-motif cell wall-anchored protein
LQTETLRMTVLDGDSFGLVVAGLLLAAVIAGAGFWYFVRRRKEMTNA